MITNEHIETLRADLNDARDALTEALNARHEELVARAKTAEAEVARLSGLVRDFNTAAGILATERDDQTDRADRLDAVVYAVREVAETLMPLDRRNVLRALGEEEA